MLFLLGLMDIVAGVVIALRHFHIVSGVIVLIVGSYLVVKGLLFWGDILSFLDLLAGLYLFLLLVYPINLLSSFFSVYLIAKGLWSLKA